MSFSAKKFVFCVSVTKFFSIAFEDKYVKTNKILPTSMLSKFSSQTTQDIYLAQDIYPAAVLIAAVKRYKH